MAHFRCYAFNSARQILAAEDVEAEALQGAIEAGERFVAATAQFHQQNTLLEVWQGKTLLFAAGS